MKTFVIALMLFWVCIGLLGIELAIRNSPRCVVNVYPQVTVTNTVTPVEVRTYHDQQPFIQPQPYSAPMFPFSFPVVTNFGPYFFNGLTTNYLTASNYAISVPCINQ